MIDNELRMGSIKQDIKCETGMRFGRLTTNGLPFVVRHLNKNQLRISVTCDCGVAKTVAVYGMMRGSVKSCGCLRREVSSNKIKTHGMSKTYLYKKWGHLFDRCKGFKPRDKKNYTDMGITVCDRWKSFENFKSDMGEPPPGKHTIDRIDNSKGYSPENCRWASSMEQCNNKNNNIRISYQGREDTLANWARHLGVCRKALNYRLTHGWSTEQAFTTPYNHANKITLL